MRDAAVSPLDLGISGGLKIPGGGFCASGANPRRAETHPTGRATGRPPGTHRALAEARQDRGRYIGGGWNAEACQLRSYRLGLGPRQRMRRQALRLVVPGPDQPGASGGVSDGPAEERPLRVRPRAAWSGHGPRGIPSVAKAGHRRKTRSSGCGTGELGKAAIMVIIQPAPPVAGSGMRPNWRGNDGS